MSRTCSHLYALSLALFLGLLLPACHKQAESRSGADALPEVSGSVYRLQAQPQAPAIALNSIHSWQLQLETVAGAPVEGATFAISGGMPAHNHGLPTAPQVTKDQGAGRYLLEGMKFQMGGEWEIQFRIDAPPGQETLTLALDL